MRRLTSRTAALLVLVCIALTPAVASAADKKAGPEEPKGKMTLQALSGRQRPGSRRANLSWPTRCAAFEADRKAGKFATAAEEKRARREMLQRAFQANRSGEGLKTKATASGGHLRRPRGPVRARVALAGQRRRLHLHRVRHTTGRSAEAFLDGRLRAERTRSSAMKKNTLLLAAALVLLLLPRRRLRRRDDHDRQRWTAPARGSTIPTPAAPVGRQPRHHARPAAPERLPVRRQHLGLQARQQRRRSSYARPSIRSPAGVLGSAARRTFVNRDFGPFGNFPGVGVPVDLVPHRAGEQAGRPRFRPRIYRAHQRAVQQQLRLLPRLRQQRGRPRRSAPGRPPRDRPRSGIRQPGQRSHGCEPRWASPTSTRTSRFDETTVHALERHGPRRSAQASAINVCNVVWDGRGQVTDAVPDVLGLWRPAAASSTARARIAGHLCSPEPRRSARR